MIIGKIYKTRSGREVIITGINPHTSFPYSGYFVDSEEESEWTLDGRFNYNRNVISPYDLIEQEEDAWVGL